MHEDICKIQCTKSWILGEVQATYRNRWLPFEGQVGGHILLAIARDENDNIFPVALGVVEQENKDSWVWFLQTFAYGIGRPDELNLVFILDR